jgi:hypothetical protein
MQQEIIDDAKQKANKGGPEDHHPKHPAYGRRTGHRELHYRIQPGK